jgi:hypothetical protein
MEMQAPPAHVNQLAGRRQRWGIGKRLGPGGNKPDEQEGYRDFQRKRALHGRFLHRNPRPDQFSQDS